ncbi:MAG: AEC family transporter [Paracoccaceae bacterium]
MSAIVEVILPVFMVVGFGYLAAWRSLISAEAIDGLMRFTQNFAIPCLLFSAIAKIDLSSFNFPLWFSYYAGAFTVYFIARFAAQKFLKRSAEDSISIGFSALFPNSLLLGLAIMERAYGPESLAGNYVIVSTHAPLLYAFGVIVMEFTRAKTGTPSPLPQLAKRIGKSLITNPIIIGIMLGFAANFSGLTMPASPMAAIDMMARAALPAALFGLGGVLVRYRPEGDMKAIMLVTILSLTIHPTVSYALSVWGFHLDQAQLRSVVVTAAMAPGINAYLFANMYGAAKRVAASSVLIATGLSIITVPFWLWVLP